MNQPTARPSSLDVSTVDQDNLTVAQPHYAARLLDAVEQAIMATNLDGIVTYWNRFAERLYGWSAQEAVGRSVIDLIVVSDQPPENILYHLRQGQSWSAEIHVRHRDGRVFPVQVTRSPVRDEDGRLIAIVGVSADISQRRSTEAALRSSEERLRVAQQAGGIGTFEWIIASGEVKVSPEFCALWGLPPNDILRVGLFTDLVHPDDRNRLASTDQRPLADAVGYTEYRIRRFDTGKLRWLARRGEVMYSEAGQPQRVVGVSYDVTERKQAEEQQDLITHELAHRVKNTLVLAQSIARYSLRNAASLKEAEDVLTARLVALGAAHEALIEGQWTASPLASVVAGAVQAHGSPGQISWAGEDLKVGPQATLALSLALHELCTNAVKYGALSVPEGRVDIGWRVESPEGPATLRFSWHERNGPPVTPPSRAGFGSRLIQQGLEGALGGSVAVDYATTGMSLVLTAELARVQDARTLGQD